MHSLKRLPPTIAVAISGGVDSVVLTHFCLSQKRDVKLLFYHHGNDYADQEESFVRDFANRYSLRLTIRRTFEQLPAGESREALWRNLRYEWFHSIREQVAVGTTLDDAVEWYLMTCLTGEGHYMTYSNENVIRPLLLYPKEDIIAYAKHHKLEWLEDPSNQDVSFAKRNLVRHEILPVCLKAQPGLYNLVKRRIERKEYNAEGQRNVWVRY